MQDNRQHDVSNYSSQQLAQHISTCAATALLIAKSLQEKCAAVMLHITETQHALMSKYGIANMSASAVHAVIYQCYVAVTIPVLELAPKATIMSISVLV
jgi:hypothetical protein